MSEQASVHIAHADIRGGSAKYGGAVDVTGPNVTVGMMNTRISNAASTGDGGGITVSDFGRLSAFNCIIQNCSTAGTGGGINADLNSTVLLVNTSLLHNTAEFNGGGMATSGMAKVTLQDVTAQGNKASYGGGLALGGEMSLELVGVSRLQLNDAQNCGGGVFITTDDFVYDDILGTSEEGLLVSTNNTSPDHSDVCLATTDLEVVWVNNTLDNFVATLDSDGGILHAILKLSGPQGIPTDDPIAFTIFNSQNKTVSTQTLEGRPADYPHEGLLQVSVKIKQPPGGQQQNTRCILLHVIDCSGVR